MKVGQGQHGTRPCSLRMYNYGPQGRQVALGRDSHTQLYFGLLVFMNGTEGREVGGGHGGTQTLQSEENIDFGFSYQENIQNIQKIFSSALRI